MTNVTVDAEGGLDLSQPDSWTAEEQERFRVWYEGHKGGTMPGHDFWIENDPAALKRYRIYAIEMNAPSSRQWPKVAVLGWLHFYAIIGFEDGILYQIRNAQARGGADKRSILATLETAFLHSGPLGTRFVATAAQDYLRDFEDPQPTPWPPGWLADPEAFAAGLDFNQPGVSAAELAALRGWYVRNCGEVPRYVEFLARYRPAVLKAYRMRYEHALRDALPKQMMPLLQLQWQVTRGCAPGIREAVALAKGFGVSKELVLDAVCRAMLYTGPAAISVVDEAAGDLLLNWQ
jgi:hypothetical protein